MARSALANSSKFQKCGICGMINTSAQTQGWPWANKEKSTYVADHVSRGPVLHKATSITLWAILVSSIVHSFQKTSERESRLQLRLITFIT